MNLQELVRPNIWSLKPYSSARDEFKGEASVYLDANENPYNAPYNRYPDPLQWVVKEQIEKVKGVSRENILLGNGSDEPIDLVFRAFCEPGVENVVAIDPTYGMYQVCADINNIEYRKVRLTEDFQLDVDALMKAVDAKTKIIFLCSPNNPTGNAFPKEEIIRVLNGFGGIVIVDEAYIDFSDKGTFLSDLDNFPNLIVLQTFSKAWGSAAIRLGMAFASKEIISVLNKIKYPYNVNQLTQEQALKVLANADQVKDWVNVLLNERQNLVEQLNQLPYVQKIYPTDANFVLVKVGDANGIYNKLVEQGIIVRNRHSVTLCEGCLRITVGTPEENKTLLDAMKAI
ncbi:histidinol-phosphate transaminase [Parabacteroides sp. FAFU027]|uniref:histidinol-phosphate transaminase n=1 Tax=Parabacteroides sp. FAFU027 TaxID=2922715 RepID=UPI001FAEC1F4|nr:histidinol-phosphate transaminase [Parabacteroides sp. FAFU027]